MGMEALFRDAESQRALSTNDMLSLENGEGAVVLKSQISAWCKLEHGKDQKLPFWNKLF